MKPFVLTPRPQRERAFTIVELLVVVAVIALLLTLRISALASAKDQTLRGQCAGHLRQIALATTIIANDNGGNFPVNTTGTWPWDMSANIGNTLTNFMSFQTLYCPASGFTSADNSLLWAYSDGLFHVTGYAQTFYGTAGVTYTNLNGALTPQRIRVTAPLTLVLPAALESQRVLFADSTISLSGQSSPALVSKYQWTSITGGFYVGGQLTPFRTDHMDGALPAGGNLAMLDGHVEWRRFSLMVPRTSPQVNNVSIPVWWW